MPEDIDSVSSQEQSTKSDLINPEIIKKLEQTAQLVQHSQVTLQTSEGSTDAQVNGVNVRSFEVSGVNSRGRPDLFVSTHVNGDITIWEKGDKTKQTQGIVISVVSIHPNTENPNGPPLILMTEQLGQGFKFRVLETQGVSFADVVNTYRGKTRLDIKNVARQEFLETSQGQAVYKRSSDGAFHYYLLEQDQSPKKLLEVGERVVQPYRTVVQSVIKEKSVSLAFKNNIDSSK